MHMHGFVTHVTYYNLVFLIVESAAFAFLAFRALPWLSLDIINIKRWLVTITMKNSVAFAALNDWSLLFT